MNRFTKKIIRYVYNLLPVSFQHSLLLKKRGLVNHLSYTDILNHFKQFSFIQVGANDGVSFDTLFDYVSNKRFVKAGIVVEPIKEYFIELEKNYSSSPNITCVNFALHPDLSEIYLHKVDQTKMNDLPEWVKGIASIFEGHHTKLGIPNDCMVKEEVPCISLQKLMDKFSPGNSHFNLLQIDTEGFDAEIIKMIDFKTMQFDIIKFERVNLKEPDYTDVVKILKTNNYYLIEEAEDTLAIKNSVRLTIK